MFETNATRTFTLEPLPTLSVQRKSRGAQHRTKRPADPILPDLEPLTITDRSGRYRSAQGNFERNAARRHTKSGEGVVHRDQSSLDSGKTRTENDRSNLPVSESRGSAGTSGAQVETLGHAAITVDVAAAIRAGLKIVAGPSPAELIALVSVALVEALRTSRATMSDVTALDPIGLSLAPDGRESVTVADADRLTWSSCLSVLDKHIRSRSGEPLKPPTRWLGVTSSGHRGALFSVAPLRLGLRANLDLGTVQRSLALDAAADGSEVLVRQTSVTATLAYATGWLDESGALSLLADLQALLQDGAWLDRQTRGG